MSARAESLCLMLRLCCTQATEEEIREARWKYQRKVSAE
jgi:hypothetical protein